jgi:flagellar biosynthesis GTPase FlhF
MRERIILVAFTVAGLLILAAPTSVTAFWGAWEGIIGVGKSLVALEKAAAKAAAKAQSKLRLAKALREAAEKAKTLDPAKAAKAEAEAVKVEAEAAKAQEEAASAAREAAKKRKARGEAEEKSPVREVAEDAVEEGIKEGVKKVVENGAEGVAKTNAVKPLPALLRYLIAIPAIMLGGILFLGGIILLLEPRYKTEAERLEAIREQIRRNLEKAATKFITTGERPGVWLKV